MEVYKEACETRLVQMKDSNLRMEYDVESPYTAGATSTQVGQALAFGGK